MVLALRWLRPEVRTGHTTWLPQPPPGGRTSSPPSAAGRGLGLGAQGVGGEGESEEEGDAGGEGGAFHALDFYAALRPTGVSPACKRAQCSALGWAGFFLF